MYRTDDPAADYDRWMAEQEGWESRLPRCKQCGEMIDEYVYDIDGDVYCEDCMNKLFRRDVERYMA